MAKSTKAKQVETEENVAETPVEIPPTPTVIEEVKPQIIIMQPASKKEVLEKVEGKTFEEKLLNYVKNCGGEAAINDFIKLEFKTLSEQQETSKNIKGVLSKLVSERKIVVKEDFSKLGKFFYIDGNPVTQYHTAANTKLTVVLL